MIALLRLFRQQEGHIVFHFMPAGCAHTAGLTVQRGMAEPAELHNIFITPGPDVCQHLGFCDIRKGKAEIAQNQLAFFGCLLPVDNGHPVFQGEAAIFGDGGSAAGRKCLLPAVRADFQTGILVGKSCQPFILFAQAAVRCQNGVGFGDFFIFGSVTFSV